MPLQLRLFLVDINIVYALARLVAWDARHKQWKLAAIVDLDPSIRQSSMQLASLCFGEVVSVHNQSWFKATTQ